MFSAVGGFRSQPPGDINLTKAFLVPAYLYSNDGLEAYYADGSPIAAWGFDSTSGFNSYITVPYDWGTGTLYLAESFDVAFSSSFDAAAVTFGFGGSTTTYASPFVKVYGWNQDGFRTKYSDPVTPPSSNGRGITFDLTDDHIIVGQQGSPYINAWEWNSTTGFGTKLSDPSTALPNSNNVLQFNKSGNAIAVGHGTSPFISVYAWSGSGFGTKYSNASSLIGGLPHSISFRTTDDTIALAHNVPIIGIITGLSVYQWDNSTGFGTRYSRYPSDSVTHRGVDFNPTGDTIVFGRSPSAQAWTWNSSTGFGTKYNGNIPLSYGQIKFSADGNSIQGCIGNVISVWNWDNGWEGTAYYAGDDIPYYFSSIINFATNF